MRPWLIAMLLLTAVLAGCADDTNEPMDGTSEDGTGDGQGADDGSNGNETSDGDTGAVNNTAPVANLTADLLNGTAPLGVNFTLDGSDADGDDLTWVIAINGNQTANGTTLPAAFNFTFEAGNHTVLLTVSDGQAQANASLAIPVSAAPATAGDGPDPIFKTLHMVEGCELCVDGDNPATGMPGADGCIGWNLAENELDCGWVAIPEGYDGLPWSAYSYTDGTIPELGTDGDVDVEFYDACEAGATRLAFIQEASFGDPESGIIPEGARCIVGFEFSWPNAGHTIEFSLGEAVHE